MSSLLIKSSPSAFFGATGRACSPRLAWTLALLILIIYSFGVVLTEIVFQHCGQISNCPEDLTSHWANLRLSHFSRKCSPCVHRWIVNKEIGNDCTGSGNTFAPSFCHLIVCTWAGLRLQQYKLFTQTQVLMLYHVRGCWH